ncbi:MAG: SgcJ/EcaC family oxidoreductase [Acidobacteriota bacterium]
MANNDDQAVQDIVGCLEASWNTHDMNAFGDLFAEDADFVNVFGMRWRDKKTIREQHRALHNSVFSKSRLTMRDTTVLFPAEDVAIARSLWDLVGLVNPAGEPQPDRRGILTHVLQKRQGRWVIIVSQNTDIVTPPK